MDVVSRINIIAKEKINRIFWKIWCFVIIVNYKWMSRRCEGDINELFIQIH